MKRISVARCPLPVARAGYTIIEALVVVSITILMAGILIAYNHSSERELSLAISQAKVIGVLTRAKSYTLERYAVPGFGGAGCGFGVYFEGGSPAVALIFQDRAGALDERCFTDVGDRNFNMTYDPGELVESIPLGRGVSFGSPLQSIAFEAPYLKVYSDGTQISAPEDVVLVVESGSEARITVGPGGDIGG